MPTTRRMALGALAAVAAAPRSAVAVTEPAVRAVLFDDAGHRTADGRAWTLPLHAWVYRPQKSRVRKAAIARLLKATYDLEISPASEPLFDHRINLLLADNTRGHALRVVVPPTQVTLPATAANGHSRGVLVWPGQATSRTVEAVTAGGVRGRFQLLEPEGVSVISDIDDTVKATGVLDRASLWRSTFYEPFKSVPGMAALLHRLAGPHGGVHYVSSSPWHLYEPLSEWLAADGFPVSSIHLKQIRLKDRTILDILESPETLKPPVISALLQRWPRRRFVLVGDSGERDPEVYAGIARRFPDQIARVLIRRAPGDQSPQSRFQGAFQGISPKLWQMFDHPDEIA